MKVTSFCRVSTTEQNNERQLNDLRGIATKQGWEIVAEVTEQISGAKSNEQREGLQKLFRLAASGAMDKVMVSEVSRLGRKVSEVLKVIEQLAAFKVSIYVANIGMETLLPDGRENFMFKPILVTLAGFAEMERELLRERIVSGMQTARKNGKHIGRRQGSTECVTKTLRKYPEVVKYLKKGRPIREVAKLAAVSPATVQKVKKAMKVAA